MYATTCAAAKAADPCMLAILLLYLHTLSRHAVPLLATSRFDYQHNLLAKSFSEITASTVCESSLLQQYQHDLIAKSCFGNYTDVDVVMVVIGHLLDIVYRRRFAHSCFAKLFIGCRFKSVYQHGE